MCILIVRQNFVRSHKAKQISYIHLLVQGRIILDVKNQVANHANQYKHKTALTILSVNFGDEQLIMTIRSPNVHFPIRIAVSKIRYCLCYKEPTFELRQR